MTGAATLLWPWVVLAGLGLYHGVNPAMGWLFAVALGLHRKSQQVVLLSLFPIALGHAAAVALVLAVVVMLGLVVDPLVLSRLAGGDAHFVGAVASALVFSDGKRAWRGPDACPGAAAVVHERLVDVAARSRRSGPGHAGRARRPYRRHAGDDRGHLGCRLQLDRGRLSAPRLDQSRSRLDRRASGLRRGIAGPLVSPVRRFC